MNLSWVALSKRTRLASLSLVFPLDHFFFFFALPPDGLVGLAFPPFACCFGGIFLLFCLTSRWLGWLSLSSLCLLLWWHIS